MTETRTAKLSDMLAAIRDPATLDKRSDYSRRVALEFADKVETIRRAGEPLSPARKNLLAELYREALALVGTDAAKVQGEGLVALRALFDKAAARGAKKLACAVKVEGKRLHISRAPDTGKNPGALYVKDAGAYAGKILEDGTWRPTEDAAPDLGRVLGIFGRDPAGLAGAYGLETGICAWCARELNDPVSRAVGYGPVCAKRYRLPHKMPVPMKAEAVAA